MNAQNAEVVSPASAGPGGQLRQARLDLKLAPEDVANILRLSPKQIVALENDDFASLPGATYVRGYLRSYAQLLGLSPERIVESYNQFAAAAAPVDLTKLAVPEEVTSRDYRVQIVTAALAVFVVGLSAMWWLGQDKDEAEPPSSVAVATPERAAEPGTAVTGESPPFVAGGEPPVVVAPGTAATSPGPLTTPGIAPATPAALAPAAPPSAEPVASGPKVRLVLRAEQECWADVRDANGNKLFYTNIEAGRVVTLVGTAPLSVFLGNVDGVQVEYNGQPFDAKRYRHGPVARFTLGEKAVTN
jgi:cytoskeleton protein RodZ